MKEGSYQTTVSMMNLMMMTMMMMMVMIMMIEVTAIEWKIRVRRECTAMIDLIRLVLLN